ncbi:hypothetical protein QUF90_24240 [Desulfococcaceae bacterium HSG9]|nr:hypothetical protein [Desulfococcaceae bacterium HSG9]
MGRIASVVDPGMNYLSSCTKYIEQNPVKAGLVKNLKTGLRAGSLPYIRRKDDILVGSCWIPGSYLGEYP